MPHPLRRLLLSLLAALLVLAVIESASALFFHVARDRFAFAEPGQYVLDAARLAVAAGQFDPELGWVSHYPTPFGERPRPREWGRPLLMTFGDSHTHGDEVEDAETWEAYLADELRADVLNLGVSGYGPDQALLRFRQMARAGRVSTPIVGLGFVLENINRVVNRYRPFYFRLTGIPLTKPRFVRRGAQLELLPNPIASVAELQRLRDPAFVHRLGQDDVFYSSSGLPRLGFPYARLLLSPAIWRQALERRPRTDVEGRPPVNLWRNDDARGIFLGILDLFVADVRAAGAEPVLIILPGRFDIESRRLGRGIPGYERVLRHCRERGHPCFDGIAALGATAGETRLDLLFRRGGHGAPLGNRLVALGLARFLRERGAPGLPVSGFSSPRPGLR